MATIRNYKDIQLQASGSRSVRDNPHTPEYLIPDTPINFNVVVTYELSSEGNYELIATLSWDAVSSENTGYSVYYNITGDTDIQSFKLQDTNYIFTSINKTESYEFWVTAVNVNVESAISIKETVNFTTDVIAPSPLTALSLYSGAGVSVISWAIPSERDFSHVELVYGLTNDRALITDTDTSQDSSYNFVNTIQGEEYFFWTRTVDYTGNESAWFPLGQTSGFSVVTSLDSQYITPANISNVSLATLSSLSDQGVFTAELKITWDALVSNVSGYKVEITNTNTLEVLYIDTETSNYILPAAIAGNTYSVKVQGVNFTSYGSYSTAETLLIAGDVTSPSKPTSVSVNNVVGGIYLAWINPVDNDFATTEVHASQTNDIATATLKYSSDSTAYTFPESTEGVTWYFWLKSLDTTGNDSGFEPATTTTSYSATTSGDYTFSAPTTPVITTALGTTYSGRRGEPYAQLQLEYTSSSNATNYTIRWITVADSPGVYEEREVVGTTAYVYQLPVEDHYVSVKAHNYTASSAFSADTLVSISANTTPNADPTDLFIDVVGSYANLSWTNSTEVDFRTTLIFRSLTNDSSTATEVGDAFGNEAWSDQYYGDDNYYYWIKFEDNSTNLSGFYPSQFAGVFNSLNYAETVRERVSFTDLGTFASGTVSPDIDTESNNFKLTLTGAGVTIDAPTVTLTSGLAVYGKIHIIGGDTNIPLWGASWSFCGGIEPELENYSIISFSKLFGDTTVFAWSECHPDIVPTNYLVDELGNYLVDDSGNFLISN